MWMVPCVVYSGRSERWKVSYTIPCPENAASPCNSTDRTCIMWFFFHLKNVTLLNKCLTESTCIVCWTKKNVWTKNHNYIIIFYFKKRDNGSTERTCIVSLFIIKNHTLLNKCVIFISFEQPEWLNKCDFFFHFKNVSTCIVKQMCELFIFQHPRHHPQNIAITEKLWKKICLRLTLLTLKIKERKTKNAVDDQECFFFLKISSFFFHNIRRKNTKTKKFCQNFFSFQNWRKKKISPKLLKKKILYNFPRTHPLALRIAVVELLSPGLALHHRVHRLQMRRVGADGQSDVLVGHAVKALLVCAEMVLHVSRTLLLRIIITLSRWKHNNILRK